MHGMIARDHPNLSIHCPAGDCVAICREGAAVGVAVDPSVVERLHAAR
jgi:hypothetical protein